MPALERNKALYLVFVDFTKAFDTVNRSGLWQILRKFGCWEKFTCMIESLHTDMKAQVTQCNSSSIQFDVIVGVKQGCVLAPTLFSLYLSAMLEEAFRNSTEGVYIQTRPDANLFKLSHFNAKTKTTLMVVREMLFADDCALVSHSAEEKQRLVDGLADAAIKYSLKISIKKTEVLYQSSLESSLSILKVERLYG